jgi:hypothetical protein
MECGAQGRSAARWACAHLHRVRAGGRPAERPSGAISIAAAEWNSGRRGVPPPGGPAPTYTASAQARRRMEFGAQGRSAARWACAHLHRVRAGAPPNGMRGAGAFRRQVGLRPPTPRPRRRTPGGTPLRRDFNRRRRMEFGAQGRSAARWACAHPHRVRAGAPPHGMRGARAFRREVGLRPPHRVRAGGRPAACPSARFQS